MKTLIVEDDFITSQIMSEIFSEFGACEVAENGKLAIDRFVKTLDTDEKFDLICLDIMMPEVDGQETLLYIREIERQYGVKGLDCVKVIMTTALNDFDNIKKAFSDQAEAYLIKPLEKEKLVKTLQKLNLIF